MTESSAGDALENASSGVAAPDGRSGAEALHLLHELGPNALPETKPAPIWLRFVRQFQNQCLAQGRAMWAWGNEHVPLRPQTTKRLAAAFVETGRGLIVGAGLTSLLQAAVATVLFAALSVPRAIVLGAITFVASIIPAVGTSVVWLPVAAGLALRGDYVRATILLLVGALGISTIDNVTRPLFQRWGGKLDLPAFLLLLAAFGGLKAFGPAGLALGPLSLRMAREVLAIAKERRSAVTNRL